MPSTQVQTMELPLKTKSSIVRLRLANGECCSESLQLGQRNLFFSFLRDNIKRTNKNRLHSTIVVKPNHGIENILRRHFIS